MVDLLGGGGMKQVWLARDRRLGVRTCALAEMIDSFRTPTARIAAEAAFKREAELLASLSTNTFGASTIASAREAHGTTGRYKA